MNDHPFRPWHLLYPRAPQDGRGRSSCHKTTHPRAPCGQRYPGGPQELDAAHLLVIHPQHVIEVVLLGVIFNQKIHLENPRAELQLQAQHPHCRCQGGGDHHWGTLWHQLRAKVVRRGGKPHIGQAGPLAPTLHTCADHSGVATVLCTSGCGRPSLTPGGCTHICTYMTAVHPMAVVLRLSVQGDHGSGGSRTYLIAAIVPDNGFQKGFGPLAQIAHPTGWKHPTIGFSCVTDARGNFTIPPGLSLVNPDFWPLLPLPRSLNVPPAHTH